MAKRIKVTGYLNPDDMDPDDVDLDHEMGLSSEGFDRYASQLALDDITFELEDD